MIGLWVVFVLVVVIGGGGAVTAGFIAVMRLMERRSGEPTSLRRTKR